MLAIIGLPTLMPFVVRAQYAVDAVPVTSDFRIKVERYRCEKERLPGLGFKSDGILGSTSQLSGGLSRVQTFCGTNVAAFTEDFGKVVVVTNGGQIYREIDVDITGKKLRPTHIQYRVDVCESNRYVYATGSFGNDDGLPSGTGYAVLEARSGTQSVHAVWGRYEAMVKSPGQAVLVNADEARRYFGCVSTAQARKMNLCWAGDPDALVSKDATVRNRAVAELLAVGWDVNGVRGVSARWFEVPGAFRNALPAFLMYVLIIAVVVSASTWKRCWMSLFVLPWFFVWKLPVFPLAFLHVVVFGGVVLVLLWELGSFVVRVGRILIRRLSHTDE